MTAYDEALMYRTRYRAMCPRCGRAIRPGDLVHLVMHHRGAVHVTCPQPDETRVAFLPRPKARKPKRRRTPLCPICRIEHRGECP